MRRIAARTIPTFTRKNRRRAINRVEPKARGLLIGVLAILLVSALSVSGQQRSTPLRGDQTQGRVKILEENGPWKLELLRQPGVLLAEGKNTIATGALRLRTYRIEEVTLRNAVRAEVDGKATELDKAWRLTVTGGPFRIGDAAAIIWIDNNKVGCGLESPDRKSVSVIVFDRALLGKGASISLSYGENDPNRTVLPERLDISPSR
ncbi:MAG TPA: hypothetical protein VEZ90_08980 [Blastocatellia bacterium]|nr:hypothetical protein [Blastocatellia bacterium]